MMGLVRSLEGAARVRITSADPVGTVSAAAGKGICVEDVTWIDSLTAELTVARRDLKKLRELTRRRGDTVKLAKRIGVYWKAKGLIRRPVLLVGMAAILFAAMYLPGRVLFVRVEGNTTVPARLILEKAEVCGIRFGASRREVRSEKMKNALLEEIPELQWAGVNTAGCVATITVRERSVTREQKRSRGVSSIVAVRDGVVTECTVTKGNGLCRVGQAVKAGEVLISGYTDCGLTIQATRAEGEVFAETKHNLTAVMPSISEKKGTVLRQEKKYALRIGKKQINFYKDSGISAATCDKMYAERYVTLPGGFQLPVALIVEEFTYYDCTEKAVSPEEAAFTLENFAKRYVVNQMVAGEILSGQLVKEQSEDRCSLYAEFSCLEMIGRVQSEEIIKGYGKTD